MTASPGGTSPAWRKSSYSGTTNNSECVELAVLADGTIAMRDCKEPAAGMLRFTRGEVRAWFAGVKAGEFDDLIQP